MSILTADAVSNDGKRSALMSGVQLPGASSDAPVNCDQVTLHERADIIDLTADLTAIQETAALLSCCDLVITVDASVAHLAATARTPDLDTAARFTRLPLVARPRRQPRYSVVRLYRQTAIREYGGVLNRVRAELQNLIATETPSRHPVLNCR